MPSPAHSHLFITLSSGKFMADSGFQDRVSSKVLPVSLGAVEKVLGLSSRGNLLFGRHVTMGQMVKPHPRKWYEWPSLRPGSGSPQQPQMSAVDLPSLARLPVCTVWM